jgi:carbamoyl-phosphate synthase large subunit
MLFVATSGTAKYLTDAGLEVKNVVAKVHSEVEETGADGVELITNGEIQLVVNSPRGRGPRADGAHLRDAAAQNNIPLLTTAAAALAAARGIADWTTRDLHVQSLQSHHSRPNIAGD